MKSVGAVYEAIMGTSMYYSTGCISRTKEWTILWTSGWPAGPREVRYVNYRPTYVSSFPFPFYTLYHVRSFPSSSPLPLSVGYLGCQPIRLGTAHRRSRCTQSSRETDESTLWPVAEKHSFCPLSISLQKQWRVEISPLYAAARLLDSGFSLIVSGCLPLSVPLYDFSRRRLTWSIDGEDPSTLADESRTNYGKMGMKSLYDHTELNFNYIEVSFM